MSENPLEYQVGGDHYQRLGQYQPWLVLQRWMAAGSPVGLEAYLAGEAVVYLARFLTDAPGKGGRDDVRKALHCLEYLLTQMPQTELTDTQPLERAIYRAYAGGYGQPVFVQCRHDGKAFIRPANGQGGGFWTSTGKLTAADDAGDPEQDDHR